MRSKLGVALVGGSAGLVAGLLLVLLQALARLALGVGPPAELIGDRVAPLLTIQQFFGLFDFFGGYQHLKQLGIGGNTLGELAVAVVLGIVYAARRRRAATGRRAAVTLAVLTALLWGLLVAALWPNLGTNFRGISPGPGTALTIVVMALTFALFAVGLAGTYRLITQRQLRTHPTPDRASDAPPSVGRRAVLVGGIGVGLALATAGVGGVLYRRATFDYDGTALFGPDIEPITPNDKFYQVTKNVIDPRVDAGLWNFSVGGAVNSARSWSLDELKAMPPVTQETTLMCISNGVGGGLESNAMWAGVPLHTLIAQAGPHDGVVEILLTAVDGYTDTFSFEKAMDPTTLVAYQMNGATLPQRHGYPARMVVPGMFGEKNLKWLTRVDLVTEEAKGFYENQGWGPNFVIPTRSRFTAPTFAQPLRAGTPVALRGTAFGGNRGVSSVEVSLDDGANWAPAQLEYRGSDLAWSLWRFDWTPAEPGEYALKVRATDRTGALQTPEPRGIIPQGATGHHRVVARVA